ncbi:MAG: TonB-dependent receptor plug domain-containing protein, partial [Rhodothermaceae bacterium]|nr:TonB-dependent receptor plug domain-containing protein [Rhodothermaceae bacterium]
MLIAFKSYRCLISLALLLLVILVPVANAQIAVRGTVIDGETDQPFPGVTVSVRGTTLGTTTASDGTYSLQVPDGDVTLVFSFVGYRTQEFNVSASGDVIDVVLQSNVLGLDEFVVVGSRRQPRLLKDSAVPVDVLGPSDLHSMGSTDVDDAVRTQIPSYNLQALNGDEAAIVRPATLRGLPTDNVIVLVNGKRRHRSGSIALSAGSLNEGAQGPDLNMIPTIALRQIEILRDGATAQYGADAIAGVFNLQLREDAQGIRARLRTGQYLKGDGRYVHAAVNTGFSLPRNGFANLSLEYRDVEPTVRGAQRDDALTLASRGYPVADPAQTWGNAEVSHSVVGFLNSGFDVTPGIRGYVFGGGGRRTQEYGFYFRAPGTETARSSVFRFGGERAVVDLKPDSGADCSGGKILPDLDARNADIQAFIDEYKGECFMLNEIFPGG